MTERHLEDFAVEEKLSRRSLVARATFFGAAMAAIGDVARAQDSGSGSYSNAVIALPDGSSFIRRLLPARKPAIGPPSLKPVGERPVASRETRS